MVVTLYPETPVGRKITSWMQMPAQPSIIIKPEPDNYDMYDGGIVIPKYANNGDEKEQTSILLNLHNLIRNTGGPYTPDRPTGRYVARPENTFRPKMAIEQTYLRR